MSGSAENSALPDAHSYPEQRMRMHGSRDRQPEFGTGNGLLAAEFEATGALPAEYAPMCRATGSHGFRARIILLSGSSRLSSKSAVAWVSARHGWAAFLGRPARTPGVLGRRLAGAP
jgi:hypothetical protein